MWDISKNILSMIQIKIPSKKYYLDIKYDVIKIVSMNRFSIIGYNQEYCEFSIRTVFKN